MKEAFTTADTEDAEDAQRKYFKLLCADSVRAVSAVVNLTVTDAQDYIEPLPRGGVV
jgi:hypothetical protein